MLPLLPYKISSPPLPNWALILSPNDNAVPTVVTPEIATLPVFASTVNPTPALILSFAVIIPAAAIFPVLDTVTPLPAPIIKPTPSYVKFASSSI